MEPNFKELERLIKEHPKEADALATQWQEFVNTHARENPEILSIESREEFLAWVAQHPEKNIDKNIWVGKEITAVLYLKTQKVGSSVQVQEDDFKKKKEEKERAREPAREALREYFKEEKKYKQPPKPKPSEFFRNVRTRVSNTGRGAYRVGRRLAAHEGRTVAKFAGRTGINIARQGIRLAIQGGRAAIMAIRTVVQGAMLAGRVGALLVSNPIGWIIIAIIVVIIIIVFLIVMFAGGGGGCHAFSKRVFVTSTRSNGDLATYVKNNIDIAFSGDGLQAGDRICQWRADTVGLGGAWIAWLSTDAIDAKDRIPDQTYVRTGCDVVVVADNKADLISSDIDAPIDKDENSKLLKDIGVWTGTHENGQRIVNDNCSGWTVGNSSKGGMTGDSGSTTYIWTHFFSSKCDDSKNHLYCFEQ